MRERAKEDEAFVATLRQLGQGHLFLDWDAPGTNEKAKEEFVRQLREFDRSYPDGIAGYLRRSRTLLSDLLNDRNPFEGCSLSSPDMLDLTDFGETYLRHEKAGLDLFRSSAVVLVAGGLGERLGYSGTKVELPVELLGGTSFLEQICLVIRAVQARVPGKHPIPLVIMTSEATHNAIGRSLQANLRFGLAEGQISLLPQILVPALSDPEAHLARKETYQLLLKPNGHGAVHRVLFSSGTARDLLARGIRHLLFVQDTNAQVFNALFAALGAAEERKFDFVYTAVRRIPNEACGALVRLTRGTETTTVNVEYHQLAPDGFSSYPGNVNGLVVRADTYLRVLERTEGFVPEFLNPKFADAGRTKFKEPARLETLMQDLPRLFQPGETAGVALFDRPWCFSPLKNRLEDARTRHQRNLPPECAGTAESDYYRTGRTKCRVAGMHVAEGPDELISGVPFQRGSRVVLRPSFALTLGETREKISGGSLGENSTLLVEGNGVRLRNVTVDDGASLEIHAVEGAEVTIEDLHVSNRGHRFRPLTEEELRDPATPEYLRIRGYRIERGDPLVCRFEKPGRHRFLGNHRKPS